MARRNKPSKRRQPPSQRPERLPYNPDDPLFLAVHEAGHAVAAAVLGLDLGRVSVDSGTLDDGTNVGGVAGAVSTSEASLVGIGGTAILPYIMWTMAGALAESRVNPMAFAPSGHARLDIETGQRIAIRAICQGTWEDQNSYHIDEAEFVRCKPEMDRLFEEAESQTKELLSRHLAAIQRVAEILLQQGSIEGSDVAAIVGAADAPRS